MNKAKPDLYYIRYLEPKESGIGVIVDAISIVLSDGEELDMKKIVSEHPSMFSKPGFYTLLHATGIYHTTEVPK